MRSAEDVYKLLTAQKTNYVIIEESICTELTRNKGCRVKDLLDIANGHVGHNILFKKLTCKYVCSFSVYINEKILEKFQLAVSFCQRFSHSMNVLILLRSSSTKRRCTLSLSTDDSATRSRWTTRPTLTTSLGFSGTTRTTSTKWTLSSHSSTDSSSLGLAVLWLTCVLKLHFPTSRVQQPAISVHKWKAWISNMPH